MIRRPFRLTSKRIEYLLKKGKKVGNEYFTLKFIPGPANMNTCRFSVIVSLKIDSKAVGRNRIRRQLYEIIRLHKDSINKNFDIAVITKPEVKNLDYTSMREVLTELFKKIN
jgi:ribonuclease P protein component